MKPFVLCLALLLGCNDLHNLDTANDIRSRSHTLNNNSQLSAKVFKFLMFVIIPNSTSGAF